MIWPESADEKLTTQAPAEGWVYYPNKQVDWVITDIYKHHYTDYSDLCMQYGRIANNHAEWAMTDVTINDEISDKLIAYSIAPGDKITYAKSIHCRYSILKWKWKSSK